MLEDVYINHHISQLNLRPPNFPIIVVNFPGNHQLSTLLGDMATMIGVSQCQILIWECY
jgi:hypothetical protein